MKFDESFEQVQKKALTTEWKVEPCFSGESCWCRIITLKEKILFKNGESQEEFSIIGSGAVNKELADHIVEVHNKSIKNLT
jgi:hypothetical protein